MPELPEVETTRRGIEPHLQGQRIESIEIRQPKLRWPIPQQQIQCVIGENILDVSRRGKYLLMHTAPGHLIWHLGMSGSMRVLPRVDDAARHEHVQLNLENGNSLRFRDPRRFGALLFTAADPLTHPLIAGLGPEPLSEAFNADYLFEKAHQRSTPIKNLIMDSHVVVGIGNIYACESLFLSGVNPKTPSRRISRQRLRKLVDSIKTVLNLAIDQGGTTLQDFTQADGKPGYFRQSLNVYANTGACPNCGTPVRRIILGQRSTFYCSRCQH